MKKSAMSMLFMCLICGTVFAATYTVTSITDDGTGTVEGTLSWAITQSNSSTSVDDDIVFNLSSGSTVTISAMMPTISDAVTIDGDDGGTNVTVQVTVPGTSTFRVFYINSSGETITIRNMTIKGGDVSASDSGGCVYIYDNAVVNLEYVTVSDSKAWYGGGIYIYDNGTLTMDNCTIKDNTAYRESAGDANDDAYGGGIYSQSGTVTINNSTISGNTAYALNIGYVTDAYIGALGGGIYSHAGTVTIDNSTISGNTAYALNPMVPGGASTYGGGLLLRSATITNSTIFGNTASSSYVGPSSSVSESAHGGGVYVWSDVSIANCTISGNEVSAFDAEGAGIWNFSSLTMVNTILADNTDNATHYDYYRYGSLTDNGYNVVEYSNVAANATGGFDNATDILYNTKYNESGTSFTSWTQGGTVFAKQSLYLSSTLALNNNPNGTYTLTYTDGNSIGIDDGTGTDPDQRGAPIYNSIKDIGAYEWEGSPGTLPVELSAFTAQYIENTPTIYWSTQSETDNMGWFIYRNEEDDFSSSEVISNMIEGHGTTTQQQNYLYEDNIQNPEVGDSYYYWLESIDYSGIINHYDKVAVLTIPEHNDPGNNGITEPERFGLFQNEPNPVISSTKISFNLTETAHVELAIYNLKGQLVKDLYSGVASKHTVMWDGKDGQGKQLENGVYLYELLINGKRTETKKLILIK